MDKQDGHNKYYSVIKNSKDPLPHLLFGASLYWTGKVDDAVSEYKEALRQRVFGIFDDGFGETVGSFFVAGLALLPLSAPFAAPACMLGGAAR